MDKVGSFYHPLPAWQSVRVVVPCLDLIPSVSKQNKVGSSYRPPPAWHARPGLPDLTWHCINYWHHNITLPILNNLHVTKVHPKVTKKVIRFPTGRKLQSATANPFRGCTSDIRKANSFILHRWLGLQTPSCVITIYDFFWSINVMNRFIDGFHS